MKGRFRRRPVERGAVGKRQPPSAPRSEGRGGAFNALAGARGAHFQAKRIEVRVLHHCAVVASRSQYNRAWRCKKRAH